MSGISGLYFLDGRPAEKGELAAMMEPLRRRGPDGVGMWTGGAVGLGHTALNTTPEALLESQPVSMEEGRLVITADARIDNRPELIGQLGLEATEASILGDSEFILRAYQLWGIRCPERLLGDFAFAIWDAGERRVFCARDHFGIRPFNYHHAPGRLFAWASEVRAVLTLDHVPHRINEGRIADFLITQLEGVDKTSTFFEEVYRLPPAHRLIVTPDGIRIERYWELKAGPELNLESDDAYDEAFLDVFSEAIQCRLRGADTVGSMLSGGMDSGSIVAVARELRSQAGEGPLPTFSAVGPDPETCVETRTIHAALTMGGLAPHLVNHACLDELLPELEELTWSLEEPFDGHMTLNRAVYLDAHRHRIKAILDGIDGDNVLSEGAHIARLLRRGRWLTAYRDAVGQERFWGAAYPAWRELTRSVGSAFAPKSVMRLYRMVRRIGSGTTAQRNIESSVISPDFARRVGLADRLETLAAHSKHGGPLVTLGQERVRSLDHPYLTVGVERYNRIASAVGIEPRHPFLDTRVVSFCVALPGEQKITDGWPKAILRRAMAGRLPDAVRWRRGKEHLGWDFTAAMMGAMGRRMQVAFDESIELLSSCVDVRKLHEMSRSCFDDGDSVHSETVFETALLGTWLGRQAGFVPIAAGSGREMS